MLVAGRIISGISVGLASAVIPIYQSEITAPAIRGRMVSLQQWYEQTSLTYFNQKWFILILGTPLGLSHGVFSFNISFSSVVRTSMVSLHSEFLGVFR